MKDDPYYLTPSIYVLETDYVPVICESDGDEEGSEAGDPIGWDDPFIF